MINYAHRGFSERYPENTMYAFYMALEARADGIETDIQRTADGVPVLFHDATLERILGIGGSIRDHTLAELSRMDFGAWKGAQFAGEPIVTLEEFLRRFGMRRLSFALELKQEGVGPDVLEAVGRFGVRDRVILTSFMPGELAAVRRLDPDIRLGYLTREADEEAFRFIAENRIQQLCPHIDRFSGEQLARAREAGLSVRFWGISSRERMMKAIESGADGMTVNDPSALSAALGRL